MKCCLVCNHRGKRSALDKLLSPLKDLLTAKMRLVENLLKNKKPSAGRMSCSWVPQERCEDKPKQVCHPVLSDVCEEVSDNVLKIMSCKYHSQVPHTVCDPTVRNVCQKETRLVKYDSLPRQQKGKNYILGRTLTDIPFFIWFWPLLETIWSLFNVGKIASQWQALGVTWSRPKSVSRSRNQSEKSWREPPVRGSFNYIPKSQTQQQFSLTGWPGSQLWSSSHAVLHKAW